MKANIRKLSGNWDVGYALDKHMLQSTFLGYNALSRPIFDNQRTEAGEAVYQLKYRSAWDKATELAEAIKEHIVPLLPDIGLLVPMPASIQRVRQPVNAISSELARLLGLTSFENIIEKAPSATGVQLKNLHTKAEKDAELVGRFSINDGIAGTDKWNVLLIDDLFDSGASMQAATSALRGYVKIDRIMVVALTWK